MTLEHAAVRERLIAATLALMNAGGLDAVKARAVAGEVGVSVGTVYNLFENVDGLVLAANMQIYADLNTLGQQRMGSIETELGEAIGAGRVADNDCEKSVFRLLGLSRAYIDFVATNANRWSALLAFNRSRKIAATDKNYMARQDALIDIIGRVLMATPLAAAPERRRVAARALWSSVHGIVTMNYFGADEDGARQRTWEQIEMLVTAFIVGIFTKRDQ